VRERRVVVRIQRDDGSVATAQHARRAATALGLAPEEAQRVATAIAEAGAGFAALAADDGTLAIELALSGDQERLHLSLALERRALERPVPAPTPLVPGSLAPADPGADALQLRQLARRRAELNAAIAHDLRSPLAAVKGAIDLLSAGHAGDLSDEQIRYLGIADRASRHVLELVSDLLDVSILDAGLARLQLATIELRPFLEEVLATHEVAARRKRIALALDAPPVLPTLLADRRKLSQVLGNLLANAVKFTHEDGHIWLGASPVAGDRVELLVSDDGIGIPAARQSELFDKYRRRPSRGTRGERGTGLGLYICKQLVELHDGHIAVESQLGHGTRFRMTFPLAPPNP
jgi:signal transduction histidine kinase